MAFLARLIDRLGIVAVTVGAVGVLVLTLLMSWGVFSRYVLAAPIPWIDDAVRYVLAFSVMLAVADVMRRGEAIRVDVVLELLPPRVRRPVEIAGLVAALFFAVTLTWLGVDMVMFSADLGLTTASTIDVPSAWVEAALPLGGALLTLATAIRLWRAVTHRLDDDALADTDRRRGGDRA